MVYKACEIMKYCPGLCSTKVSLTIVGTFFIVGIVAGLILGDQLYIHYINQMFNF